MMNSIERFNATVKRQAVDRPACWLGMPTSSALPGLFKYFGVQSPEKLKAACGDDYTQSKYRTSRLHVPRCTPLSTGI